MPPDPVVAEVRPRWLVTCSCGWGRECSSRWAAESLAKLHPKLSALGTEHTITIEEPPADSPGREQLPLTWRYPPADTPGLRPKGRGAP